MDPERSRSGRGASAVGETSAAASRWHSGSISVMTSAAGRRRFVLIRATQEPSHAPCRPIPWPAECPSRASKRTPGRSSRGSDQESVLMTLPTPWMRSVTCRRPVDRRTPARTSTSRPATTDNTAKGRTPRFSSGVEGAAGFRRENTRLGCCQGGETQPKRRSRRPVGNGFQNR